jgi:hypothetical protein
VKLALKNAGSPAHAKSRRARSSGPATDSANGRSSRPLLTTLSIPSCPMAVTLAPDLITAAISGVSANGAR